MGVEDDVEEQRTPLIFKRTMPFMPRHSPMARRQISATARLVLNIQCLLGLTTTTGLTSTSSK